MSTLPPLAPFPKASWQTRLSSAEWTALVQAWQVLCQAYLALLDEDFVGAADSHASLVSFTSSFVHETASAASPIPGSAALLRPVFDLASRLLMLLNPPTLLQYEFLASFAKTYPASRSAALFGHLFNRHSSATVMEASLTSLQTLLIDELDSGIKGDLKLVESRLVTLNPLLHVSPHACTLLAAGSDFFDGLITCYKVMNPPLRRAIIATMYLCVMGLVKCEPAKWSMLNDQLFALNSAADAHKRGPLNANDSLVAELVTSTPLLKRLSRRAEAQGVATASLKKRIAALEAFKKGPMLRPRRCARRKLDKGKGRAARGAAEAEMHIHRLSQMTQVQDLFPDLGAGFVAKCLDEYGDDVEQVVANLLGESLPTYLASADRSEPLSSHDDLARQTNMAPPPFPSTQPQPPPPPPPQIPPTRRNVFDGDDLDRLSADVSRITFGKKPQRSADQLLEDKSSAPDKAAILSALAAFDADDDERDDTYDAADVGGTVDATNQEADDGVGGDGNGREEALFRAYEADERLFGREAATRRSEARARLRGETGLTDEAIEGWALMLGRDAQQRKRLEAKYAFAGQQAGVERTAWGGGAASAPGEEVDVEGGAESGGGAGGGRGRGRGGGARGPRGGNVARPGGERGTGSARRNKEAHKGSRANHGRRDARAKKVARGGFGPAG